MHKLTCRFFMLTGLAVILAGCPGPGTSPAVISVVINQEDTALLPGDTLPLTATIMVVAGASEAIEWSSSDETVATVSATGMVEALAIGETIVTATSVFAPGRSDSVIITVAHPPGTLLWTDQFGTALQDYAYGVAMDSDANVFVTGHTTGGLEDPNAGSSDAYVRKYDNAGTMVWTRQFGTELFEEATGIAADPDGNVIVSGFTNGGLAGASMGDFDAFVRKYASAGGVLWTRQFGTASVDFADAVAVDAAGNVFVTGYTNGVLEGANAGDYDVYMRKYNSDGAEQWTRQFGTAVLDRVHAAAADMAGNVIVVGDTVGELAGDNAGSNDAFVRKYDSSGGVLWTHQFGTAESDVASGVTVDPAGNVVVVGHTSGALDGESAGGADVFVRQYDSDGTEQWTRQFGSAVSDNAEGVATDSAGNLLVTGSTYGALEGANAGDWDAFIRKYDSAGDALWTRQFGSSEMDLSRGAAVDLAGNVVVVGRTFGVLTGANAGESDVFLRMYSP